MEIKKRQVQILGHSLYLLLFILLSIAMLGLTGCSGHRPSPRLKAQEGALDFTQIQFEKNIVPLAGDWEFYSQQLLSPDEIENGLFSGYITLPGSWNKYIAGGGTASGAGYATYRLAFVTNERESLALKIPRLHTAYKLWINGELTALAGTVGKTRDTMSPQYLPQIAFFASQPGKNEIVIQVSNFYHRSGGILESIKLGGEKQILELRSKGIASDIFLFGCLVFMGFYHLALFFFRKKDRSALYFGAFCILVAIRTLLVGECFFIYLFPGFSWEIAHKIMTLTYYLGVPLILMFFLTVFPAYFHTRMVKMAQAVGIAFALLIVFTPARIFTVANPLYQIWSLAVILYIAGILIKISVHKERDSWLIVLGASALLLTTINDIVFTNVWMNDNAQVAFRSIFRTGNLTSFGQLLFTFTNSLLLAKKFSASLEQEEIITAELTAVNANLDKIVLQRTEALLDSNERIEQQKLELEDVNRQLEKLSAKDPLTKLWNRRKYDESIHLEWNRCLRHQRPLALILMDIDNFKEYNDHYGHLAGDDCLTLIGQAIGSLLSRSTDMAARYGGEEFVVVLSETEKEEAIKVAAMLRHKIEALHIPHGPSPVSAYVTVSVGVTYTIPWYR